MRLSEVPEPDRGPLIDQFDAVQAQAERRWSGQGDIRSPLSEFLTRMAARPGGREVLLATDASGVVAGAVLVRVPSEDAVDSVFLESLAMRDPADEVPVAESLLAAGEQLARERGRTNLGLLQAHRPAAGAGLKPTGGGIPIEPDALAQLLLNSGWRLDYTSKHSVLPIRSVELPEAPVASGYRLLVWPQVATPSEYLDDMAALHAGISADSPDGGLDSEPEHWTADRVADSEAADYADDDRLRVMALHEGSGRLVGYTEVSRGIDSPAVFQNATYVTADHRGHGLGLAMKTLLVAQLRELWPGAERIHSWNEGTNDPMWRINVALGVRATDVGATWQKGLG